MEKKPEEKNLKVQARLVLEYLKARKGRKLTPLAAHTFLGVASLTSRIAELRDEGFAIKDRWQVDNFKRRYKEYWVELSDEEYGETPEATAQ
jgi:hypothetical protein